MLTSVNIWSNWNVLVGIKLQKVQLPLWSNALIVTLWSNVLIVTLWSNVLIVTLWSNVLIVTLWSNVLIVTLWSNVLIVTLWSNVLIVTLWSNVLIVTLWSNVLIVTMTTADTDGWHRVSWRVTNNLYLQHFAHLKLVQLVGKGMHVMNIWDYPTLHLDTN
jgi:hypothetical protein